MRSNHEGDLTTEDLRPASAGERPGSRWRSVNVEGIVRRARRMFAPEAVLALAFSMTGPDPGSADRVSGDASGSRQGGKQLPWYLPFLGGTLVAGLPALGTFLGIAFDLFPSLKPEAPPEIRAVTITELVLGERDKSLGDGRIADAFYFEIETVGYDDDDIAVDWLLFDAQTRERLPEMERTERWEVIDIDTPSDRVSGEINVPPPSDHTGCIFVRVLLQPEALADKGDDPYQPRLFLDHADSRPYDPIDPANPTCADSAATAASPP